MNRPIEALMTAGAAPYRLSAEEFWRMVDVDLFGGRRIELVEGELLEMAPSNKPHGAMAATVALGVFNAFSGPEWAHCLDAYVTLASENVRAPDIAILRRGREGAKDVTAEEVIFAIEISHSTLKEDLERKRLHYAEAGIPHYWVVDVEGERVHRFSEPVDGDYVAAKVSTFEDALPLPVVGGTISLR